MITERDYYNIIDTAKDDGRAEGILEGKAEGILEGESRGKIEGKAEPHNDIAREMMVKPKITFGHSNKS